MNNIKNVNFLDTFPPALKKDSTMFALGKLIVEELHITANETEKNIIYTNIENLSEMWLDILAYDLHVDWYDYDYPVETKRAIIKNSIRIHQKLGTKYAVEIALRDIYKDTKVTEWFEYNGEPYHFKIIIDIGNTGLTENTSRDIEAKIMFYKSLRSHCDGIFYHLSTGKAIIRAKPFAGLGAILKVKAALPTNIGVTGAKVVTKADLTTLNSIKIKAKLTEHLRGGSKERTLSYLKNKNIMLIREE